MSYEIVIKTNSSYKYLWQIINDKTIFFEKVILLTDDKSDFEFNKNIEIMLYDSSKSYTHRLVECLSKINKEIILLIHDVDIILNFNLDKFKQMVDVMLKNEIDRITLSVFNSIEKESDIEDKNICLCKLYSGMSKNFFTPFDYAPSLYNRTKLTKFYSEFLSDSYRTLELNHCAQNYISENFKSYGIKNTGFDRLLYHRGFVYTSDFNFLHITIQGKFFSPESYFDLLADFYEIKSKYNLNLAFSDTRFIEKNELG